MFGFLSTVATFQGLASTNPDYLRSGVSMMLGANPDAGDVFLGQMGQKLGTGRYAGQILTPDLVSSGRVKGTRFSAFGSQAQRMTAGGSYGFTSGIEKLGAAGKNPSGAIAGSAMSVLGIGLSGYFAYQGYREDGIRGAANALVYDAAVMSATMGSMVTQKNIIVEGRNLSANQKKLVQAAEISSTEGRSFAFTRTGMKGFGSMIGGGLKAGLGATLGQAVGGTPGAFAGAFLGTKLNTPLTLLGLGTAAAVANVGSKVLSAGTQMVQKGYQKRVMSRRIDTAGDTAAFFTRNANTMRQRSIMAMRQSHSNARSSLGMEANLSMARRGYF